jgi:hypothetical protein
MIFQQSYPPSPLRSTSQLFLNYQQPKVLVFSVPAYVPQKGVEKQGHHAQSQLLFPGKGVGDLLAVLRVLGRENPPPESASHSGEPHVASSFRAHNAESS